MGQYLTVPELATALRRSPRSVYRDARAGLLPFVQLRPRGRILFDQDEVRAALAGNGLAVKDQPPGVAV